MKLFNNHFYGVKVSEYGIANGRVDYGTLSKTFDAVLCNEITNLFSTEINGDYIEPEQVNGYIDNSYEIDELNDRISELMEENEDESKTAEIDELQDRINELEDEQNNSKDIYQYYIISYSGYQILKHHTNEIVFYIEPLDLYIWGITHYGTSWDYVLTEIKIDKEI